MTADIPTPWDDLLWHLRNDHAFAAVEDMLVLVELGETADDIRRFLVKRDSEYWAKDHA